MSNSLQLHELQHSGLPCPSWSPWVCSNASSLSQWCHLKLPSSVVPFFSCFNLSQHQGLFQWVSSLHQVANFSFIISPFNEYSGFISFTIDWFDLLAVQRTLKSLLQHHNLKVSVLQRSAFFSGPHSPIHTWLLEKP